MNYHDLKVAHIFFAFLAMSVSMALFYGGSSKGRQILMGASCVLLLATGMAIMSRFGIQHSGPYPLWINLKLGLWLGLTIATPIVAKRFPQRSKRLFLPWMALALAAAAMAIYKPMG